MSSIFDEKNMMHALGKHLPGGETLAAPRYAECREMIIARLSASNA